MKNILCIVLAMAAVGTVSCGGGTDDPQAMIENGRTFFTSPVEDGYACSDCHSHPSSPPDRLFPAFPLAGLSDRRDFWPEYLTGTRRTVLNAALICYAKYQILELENLEKRQLSAGTGIDPSEVMDEPSLGRLNAYLKSLSDSTAVTPAKPRHPYDPRNKNARKEYIRYIQALPADAKNGHILFGRACAWCHGKKGEGVDGKGQEMKLKPHKTDVIIEQIRFGGYRMPFFRPDRLSDNDLADLVAYCSQLLAERRAR